MRQAAADLSVLIPAAGMGTRLGLGPKGLLELDGLPLITWVTRKALTLSDEVIVAVPPGMLERFRPLCPGCRCIAGGESRQESVTRLTRAARRDWLLLTEAARPFCSLELMRAVLENAGEHGAAGAFLSLDAPVALLEEGHATRAFHRDAVGVFQTPLAFSRRLMLEVQAEATRQGWSEPSTLQLLLRAGVPVRAVPGEAGNIKLTTPLEWRMARLLTGQLT